MPLDIKEEVPTAGTSKRKGRASVTPTPAAVASTVRVTRRSVATLTDDVPNVGAPEKRGRASVNPTSAAVTSSVRGTQDSAAALTDDVPTVGTPRRRGRSSVNPTPAAVASPVRVTRHTVATLADGVPTVGTPEKRGRASMNPTPAAVASPVRVTRRSAAVLAEEVPAVSSPRRKSRANINPSVTASPARVARYSRAVPAAEGELTTQPACSPARTRRKSTLPKRKSEAHDEAKTQKEKSASITMIEESPESRPSSAETSDQVDTDTKPSQLPAAERTPESTRTTRSTPSGSADDRTPETKIPTRSNRNTPPGSGSSEFRTPTRSQGGSRPSTPVSTHSPRNVSDLKTSTKPSPDRHANCNSRDSSPIFTSRDLRRNYVSSPVRHSPRSSPSRQSLHSFRDSRNASPKPSAETKPTSPLVSGKSASPSQPNTEHSPGSSPHVRKSEKGKDSSVPEKHCLEDEDDAVMMPNKRIKRDTADGEAGPSSSVDSLQEHHSPEKKLSDTPKPEIKEENTEHTSTVGDTVGVDGADSEDNEEESRSNASLSIPGIQKLSDAKTSSSEEEIVHLENTTISDEASVGEQTPPVKDEESGKPGQSPSTETSEEGVKEVACSKEEGEKGLSPVLENDSPPTDTPSASGAVLVNEPEEVVDNKVGNAAAPSSGPEKIAENEVKNYEHQELEQTVINDSDETGVEEGGNPDQDEIVNIAESPVSEERSDVTKGNSLTIEDSVVSPTKCKSEESRISVQGETLFNIKSPANEENSAVTRDKLSTIKESIVTLAKCQSEEGVISDQVKAVVNSEPLVSENPDASIGEAHSSKDSIDISPIISESEKGRISYLGEAVVSTKSPAKYSSYVSNEKTPTIRESLEVSPAKSDALLDSTFQISTIEHISVDEGYSETSDSEYHSSIVGPSDKGLKVPSIVEGLGINDMKQDVTVNLASQADSGKVTSSSDKPLENIIEEDEDVSENSSVLKSEVGTRESELSVGDQLVSSSETNPAETTIDEHENADRTSVTSPLRLAVSPEPPGSVEDDSTSKDEMGSSAMKSPSKDVENQASESLSVEDSGEKIDTTVLGKLDLEKHVVETKTGDGGEKIERAPVEQDECGPEIYDNDTSSVGDRDEDKIRDAASEYDEKKIEGDLAEPQEQCPEMAMNVCDGDTGDVNVPVKGSDFIDYEAKEGEETDEESENEENIYDSTEESDSAGSDVELLDQSCFIIDEAEEAKFCKKKSSSDSVGEDSAEEGSGTEDVETSRKVVDFDESCYIVEYTDEDVTPQEIKPADIPKNAAPDSEIAPKADKPVFEVTEQLDDDRTTVNKSQEFASGAASQKIVKVSEPLKSIMKSFKVPKNGNAYASSAASQFVVSETASEDKQEKQQLKVVERKDASTGSPQKSDSSLTSSDQEQENTKRIPKTKKRPATEAEALKEKKYKKDANAPGFCVKLCNIAPRTSIDQLKKALEEFGIGTGLQSLEFCPRTDKRKATAIAAYDSKKNLQKALASYGKVTVHDRRLFFLLDDETVSTSDDQPQAASPKKSPRKKFFGVIRDLPKNITIGDIIGAYEKEGIKFISKVKIYKLRSSKDGLNFAKLEFSKKTALLKAIIVTEKIRIRGNKISLKIKEKPSID